MIFRNESSLHHRKCSKTGKNIIAMYDENVPFPVYCPEVWFGDSWDPHDYAQDFDFNRPFLNSLLNCAIKFRIFPSFLQIIRIVIFAI